MKRTTRKSLVWVFGLMLGWYAAGHFNHWSAAHAEEVSHGEPAAHVDAHAGHGEHGSGYGEDAAVAAAKELKVDPADMATWYPRVLLGVVALFGLAVVFGPYALKSQPPDPEPQDDHGHDDHGH